MKLHFIAIHRNQPGRTLAGSHSCEFTPSTFEGFSFLRVYPGFAVWRIEGPSFEFTPRVTEGPLPFPAVRRAFDILPAVRRSATALDAIVRRGERRRLAVTVYSFRANHVSRKDA